MASVLGSLGWNIQSKETPIARLGITSDLNSLQIESQKYYIIPENATAHDGEDNPLAVTKKIDFNIQAHKEFVQKSTALFIKKSDGLKALDMKIAGSFMLWIVATSLSFLPFIGYFALPCVGLLIYQITQRTTVLNEYKESLNLLVATCNWILGPNKDDRQTDDHVLTQDEDLRNMMIALYPVLTKEQVNHLIANDIEQIFTDEQNEYEEKYRLSKKSSSFWNDKSIAGSKRSAEFNRCIYGYNKGKATDFLDAFLSVFPDIWNAITDGFKHWLYKGTDKKPEPSPAV
jgi:hypothetical protein